jgi:ATP-binding cassette subfamily D (ALD) long-chain fatty acid import protein
MDECTSAVSVDVEEHLYRQAIERGITLVTLSQQMTLPEFHPHEIRIGENELRGWTAQAVDTTQRNRLMSGVSTGNREDALAEASVG